CPTRSPGSGPDRFMRPSPLRHTGESRCPRFDKRRLVRSSMGPDLRRDDELNVRRLLLFVDPSLKEGSGPEPMGSAKTCVAVDWVPVRAQHAVVVVQGEE